MRFVMLALLLLPLSYAASDYIVAVSESAPASDVVYAANFASYMKQKADVEFSGEVDKAVYEMYDIDDLADKSLILLNLKQEQALYLIGADTTRKHGSVAEEAIEYLEDEGFTVIVFNGPFYEGDNEYFYDGYELEREDLLVQAFRRRYPVISDPAPMPPEEPVETPVADMPQETQPEPLEESVVEEVQEEPVVTPVIVVEQEEPTAVTRFFSWLRSLFS